MCSRAACARPAIPSASVCSWSAPTVDTRYGRKPTNAMCAMSLRCRTKSPGPSSKPSSCGLIRRVHKSRTAHRESRGLRSVSSGQASVRAWRLRRTPGCRRAYRRAIELDPNFAPAFAGLANVEYLAVKDFSDTAQPDVIRRALEHADHAVALAPALADPYSERALLRLNQYDWPGAQADIQKALALDPSDVKANRRMVLLQLALGNVDAALAAQRHVVDLDPLDMNSLEILGMCYYFAGQGAEARRTFERVRRL